MIDFSDLGGQPVQSNGGKLDFSDLGAQPYGAIDYLRNLAVGGAKYATNPSGPIAPVGAAMGTLFNDVAAPIKAVGNQVNSGLQMASGALERGLGNPMNPNPMPPLAQALGYAAGKVSPYLNPVPTNNLGVALMPFAAAEGVGALTKRAGQISEGAGNIVDQIIGNEPEIAQGQQKLAQATPAQKAVAYALSAANRVRPNQLSAVIANPEILSDATPSTSEVSKMYEDAFQKAGMVIDDARYKYLTGLTRPLRDQQIGKAEEILDMAFDPKNPGKLRDGLTDTEAFVARTAASKLARSTAAATNPGYATAVGKQTEALDDFLENSKLPQVRQLNRLWFMANTKEAMLEPLPLNKAGTPNALSTLLMAAQFRRAAEMAGEGKPISAAMNAGMGALMSPRIGGMAIGGANWLRNNMGALAVGLSQNGPQQQNGQLPQ